VIQIHPLLLIVSRRMGCEFVGRRIKLEITINTMSKNLQKKEENGTKRLLSLSQSLHATYAPRI